MCVLLLKIRISATEEIVVNIRFLFGTLREHERKSFIDRDVESGVRCFRGG